MRPNTPPPPRLADIATLRDVEQVERHVPLDGRSYAESTVELLDRACTRFANLPCFTQIADPRHPQQCETISYRQFHVDVLRCAMLLRQLGVSRHEVVSYVAGASIDTEVVIWGGQRAGIINPINPYLEATHISRLLRQAGTVVLVTEYSIPGLSIWEKIWRVCDEVPTLRAALVIGDGLEPSAPLPSRVPVLNFRTELERQSVPTALMIDSPSPSDTAALFHTGGTTGAPKLARHSHRNEALACQLFAEMLDWSPSDTLLVGLPLFHVNGVLLTGLAGLAAGAHIVLAGRAGFRTPGAIEALSGIIQRHSVSFISAVPTVYASWIERAGDAPTRSLRFGISGGAPMSAELARRVESRTGIRILEGYGLTEGTLCSALNPVAGERRPGSVGIRTPYQELRIARVGESGNIEQDCATGEVGEILVRGPNVFPGYLDADATALAFTSDGFLRTGDLARCDAEGYLWIVGRSKDIIIRSGHNIEPSGIEEAFEAHDSVLSAAAVGQVDEYAGELPVVFVVLRPGCRIDEPDLLEFARTRITERAALPYRIIAVDELPTTAVGKIDKVALRIRAAEWVLEQRLAAAVSNRTMPYRINAAPALTATFAGSNDTTEAAEVRRIVSALGMAVAFTQPTHSAQPSMEKQNDR